VKSSEVGTKFRINFNKHLLLGLDIGKCVSMRPNGLARESKVQYLGAHDVSKAQVNWRKHNRKYFTVGQYIMRVRMYLTE
jgi:hypothetical protein